MARATRTYDKGSETKIELLDLKTGRVEERVTKSRPGRKFWTIWLYPTLPVRFTDDGNGAFINRTLSLQISEAK